ncbi:MAG: hypothetical protein ABI615_09250 [Chthoniobacterales bacterium]
MMFNFLLVLGVIVLSLALRSFRQPIIHRIGTLGIFVCSFLAGWLFTQNIFIGCAFALSWLFLPWVEILTRIRALRLPVERTLTPRTPPSRNAFPGLQELTEEIEAEGFDYLADSGWEWDDHRQFFRLFYHTKEKLQASICLVEQSELAFYYLIVSGRDAKGNVWMTWNYPFSYGLKLLPKLKINRANGDLHFVEILESQRNFLKAKGISESALTEQTSEEIQADIQSDLREQILHNIKIGLLKKESDNVIRYSVRGMFFLWFQFLRDLVRLS